MREQLLELLRRQPFAPFRVYLVDGRQFDILYPQLNIAGRTLFTIGVPDPKEPDAYAEYFIDVDYPQIRQLELLSATPATAHG
jgi:hypothetical protein